MLHSVSLIPLCAMWCTEAFKGQKRTSNPPRATSVINRDMGKTHLMLFLEFDHGAVLCNETGSNKPKMVRLVIGNPLVMKEMAKRVSDAGSYAPVTVFDEREAGVPLSYDKMVSFLSPYANQDALRIAHDLDHKIVKFLNDAADE
jgi:hypothetical protein